MNQNSKTNELINSYVSNLSVSSSYDLTRVNKLLNSLGNPQNNLKVIHIAGTSGKTSTCYYIASLLLKNGFKVGLTASPHTESISERVQINLVPLSEVEFDSNMREFINILNKLSIKPTYFELLVCFAYWYFDKKNVDYAIIETGLGGLLDATNAATNKNKICVITDIGLDHTEILGDTLVKIAEQKAGIIHQDNIVFLNDQPKEIVDVIKDKVSALAGKLVVNENIDPDVNLPKILKRNWALALVVSNYVFEKEGRSNLSVEDISEASKVVVPGRIEVFKIDNKKIIIDGAHNNQKMQGLISSLSNDLEGQKICTIFSVGKNKTEQLLGMSKLIDEISDEIVLTSFYENQDYEQKSISPDYVESYFPDREVKKILDLEKAIDYGLKSNCDAILITGSLYLIGNARKILRSKV